MLDITKDIHSVTQFKRNTAELIRQIKESGHPLVLTLNGKADVVVVDAEAYQQGSWSWPTVLKPLRESMRASRT